MKWNYILIDIYTMKNKTEFNHNRSFQQIVERKENRAGFLSMISLNEYKCDRIKNRLNRINF